MMTFEGNIKHWILEDNNGILVEGSGFLDVVSAFMQILGDKEEKCKKEISQLKDDLSKASFISENSKFYRTYEEWIANNRGENDWIEVHLGLKIGDRVVAISDITNEGGPNAGTFNGEKGIIEKVQYGNIVVNFDCGQTIEYDPHGFEKEH